MRAWNADSSAKKYPVWTVYPWGRICGIYTLPGRGSPYPRWRGFGNFCWHCWLRWNEGAALSSGIQISVPGAEAFGSGIQSSVYRSEPLGSGIQGSVYSGEALELGIQMSESGAEAWESGDAKIGPGAVVLVFCYTKSTGRGMSSACVLVVLKGPALGAGPFLLIIHTGLFGKIWSIRYFYLIKHFWQSDRIMRSVPGGGRNSIPGHSHSRPWWLYPAPAGFPHPPRRLFF